MPPFFRNPQTGEVSAFYGDDAIAAVQAGYTPIDEGATVDVSGGTAAVEDVAELQKYRGLSTDDPFDVEAGRYERLEERRLQNEFGQTGGQIRAFGEGVLSGASLGLYDAAADALGFDTDKYAQANPDARMGGELTGMLGSAVIAPAAGGGRLAAVLAKTPAGYMSVKSAQFGKNIGGIAGSAAGAAAEGAGYAAVQTLSKALIQDEPLAAEAVFAEFGKNALFGAGISAGAAVIAGGLAKVATKLDDAGETVAPMLDLTSDASRAKVKRLGNSLQKIDALGDDIVRKFEGKPVAPRVPDVDELPLRKGPLSMDDLPHPNEVSAPELPGPRPVAGAMPPELSWPGGALRSPTGKQLQANKTGAKALTDPTLPGARPIEGAAYDGLSWPGGEMVTPTGKQLKANRSGASAVIPEGDPALPALEVKNLENQFAQAQWADDAKFNAPKQRRKLAKSVGDQVWDELVLRNDGASMGKLRKAFAKADKAVTLADEIKSKAAVAGAHKALAEYETTIAELAKSAGVDVAEQLSKTTRSIDVGYHGRVVDPSDIDPVYGSIPKFEGRMTGNPNIAENLLPTTPDLRPVRTGGHIPLDPTDPLAFQGRMTGSPELTENLLPTQAPLRGLKSVDGIELRPEFQGRMTADPGDFDVNPTVNGSLPEPLLINLADFKAFGDDLKITRQLTREALGAKSKADILSHKSIAHLLSQEPADMLVTLGRLDEYFTALRKTAEATGDARVMQRIEKALLEIDDQLDELTQGIHLDDVELDSIGTALGSDALKKPEFSNPTSARLHSMGALSKLTHDVKLKPGRTKRSMINGLAVSASARAAARGGSYAARGLVGGGGLAGAMAGGVAAASGYHAVHALANLVGGAGGRIKGAVTKLAKGTSYAANRLARPAALTAAYLIRESSFEYQPDKAGTKPARKSLHESFLDRAEELTRAAANPDATQKAIHDDLAGLRMVAPGVADELEMLSLKVPLYLAGKMPKDPGNVIRWGKSEWRPSDYEILQFGEHMRGALAPIEVYEEALSGSITPQAAEALRTIHPRLFEQMQLEIFTRSEEIRDKVDLQGQVRISVLTDVPVTSVMRPQFRSFMAERAIARAEASSAQGGKLGPSGSSGPSAAEPMTGAQQLLK